MCIRDRFQAALRAPDHGKLEPYHFVVMQGTGLSKLEGLLKAAAVSYTHLPNWTFKGRWWQWFGWKKRRAIELLHRVGIKDHQDICLLYTSLTAIYIWTFKITFYSNINLSNTFKLILIERLTRLPPLISSFNYQN